MEMVSGRLQSSIATLRGLWTVMGIETRDPLQIEFEKAASDLMQVSRIIHRSLIGREELGGNGETSLQQVNESGNT
jgi:hypothetical protein